ncbi:transcriptional regulator BetI [Hansschlegelia sp. KR7-227]|uniref:transcriptional regulator BetI n=1 Tax=Hansschlegelia sp. KR7-227 TaxID=3400914 RepID=UPI003C062CA6
MNGPTEMQSFEAARRRQLIEATIETVADLGFRAASLSEIARRANVSPGLFAHYFGDKDGLLEATLRFMAARLGRNTAERIRAAKTPLDRVLAVPESALADEEFDRRTSAVWLAFWGQIIHSGPYRRVQSIYQQRMRSNLRYGLRGLVAAERVEASSVLIAATIDGLWLQSHVRGGGPDEAVRARGVVRDLVAMLVGQGAGQPVAGARPLPVAAPTREPTLAAAERAFALWRATPGERRAETLRAVARVLHDDGMAIARLEARDTGRPVSEIAAYDVPACARAFEQAAALACRPSEEQVGFGGSGRGHLEREPLGTVLAHAHWSGPLAAACRVAAPALALGNAVVVHSSAPAERALARLVAIAEEAGLTRGALSIADRDLAERLARAQPDAVFGDPDGPPKAAVAIMEDAGLDDAAARIVRGPRAWARSRSFSETLIFVAERRRAAFVDRLCAEAASLVSSDPLDANGEVGAAPSEAHLERVLASVKAAQESGAELRLGGRACRTSSRAKLAVLEPTVLDRCREDMTIARERLFSPVLLVLSFTDDADVAARLRTMGPDLSLGLFGRDISRMRVLAREASASVCRLTAPSGSCPLIEDWLAAAPRDEIARALERTRRLATHGGA